MAPSEALEEDSWRGRGINLLAQEKGMPWATRACAEDAGSQEAKGSHNYEGGVLLREAKSGGRLLGPCYTGLEKMSMTQG